MTTWASLSKFKGYRDSPVFSFSIDGTGALSKITWDADIPVDTTFALETNVSFDGGNDWRGWKPTTNNGEIPDIISADTLFNLRLKYRTTMQTTTASATPLLRSVTFEFTPIIKFVNSGDVNCKPEIWITKRGNGDFSIINTSKGNQEFKFTGLIDGETVYVNNDREQIETDLAVTYRYSNFNDNYLDFVRGENYLKVQGNAKIVFRHQFKTLQG